MLLIYDKALLLKILKKSVNFSEYLHPNRSIFNILLYIISNLELSTETNSNFRRALAFF